MADKWVSDYAGHYAPEAEQVSHMRRVNEIVSAKEAVIEAARALEARFTHWNSDIYLRESHAVLVAALAHLDALTLPPAAQDDMRRLDKDGA